MNRHTSSIKKLRRKLVYCWLCVWALGITSTAQSQPPASEIPERIQHLYVPQDALGAALRSTEFAAVLSRDAFEELVARARETAPTEDVSRPPVAMSAEIRSELDDVRLRANVTVRVQTFVRNAELDLGMRGWNVEVAQLGDETAIVTRMGDAGETLRLFVPQPGRHQLSLVLSCPVRQAGNDQLATFGSLGAVSEKFIISLPDTRRLRVNDRPVEPVSNQQPQPEGTQRYEVPIGGVSNVELRITDRQSMSRSQRLLFASSAFGIRIEPGELTWSARTQLQVFGEPIEQLVCRIPRSLELTAVESEGLERWQLDDPADEESVTILRLYFRQPVEGNRSLTLRGLLGDAPNAPWSVPTLQIESVVSHTGTVVFQYPDGIRLQPIETEHVRPAAVVPSQGQTTGGPVRIAYEVWDQNFILRFAALLKEQQVQVAKVSILDVMPTGLRFSSSITVESRQAPLFELRVQLPAEWDIATVMMKGSPLDWQIVPDVAGVNEIRISLPQPVQPGSSATIDLLALQEPDSWPVEETTAQLPLPALRLPQASLIETVYGITTADELEVAPSELEGLDPAGPDDLKLLNDRLAGLSKSVRLGFVSRAGDITGQLEVSRRPPFFTVKALSFFQVDRETVTTRMESHLDLSGGGLRTLNVLLSESAGDQLQFNALRLQPPYGSWRIVEQVPGDPVDGKRPWTIRFDRYVRGPVVLMTEIQQPRGDAESWSPPQIEFPQAGGQADYLAIEGADDEYVSIEASSSDGTPLPTVDPVDFPMTFSRPASRVVAGYRAVQRGWSASVTVDKFDRDAIPTAIAKLVDIASIWGVTGDVRHAMRVELTAYGAQSLLLELPEEANLWSTLLDGKPVAGRRNGNEIQIPLNATATDSQSVTVVYEMPPSDSARFGELSSRPPQLAVLSGAGLQQPLEILDYKWEVHYPRDWMLLPVSSSFQSADLSLGSRLFKWTGAHVERMGWRDLGRSFVGLLGMLLVAVLLAKLFARLLQLGWFRVSLEFRWLRTLMILAVPAIVIILLMMPAVQQARQSARRSGFDEAADVPNVVANDFGTRGGVEQQYRSRGPERFIRRNQSGQDDKFQMLDSDFSINDHIAQTPSPAGPPAAGEPAPPSREPAPVVNRPAEDSTTQQFEPLQSLIVPATRGLLSMNVSLQVPENSRQQTFTYHGNRGSQDDLELRVRYTDRTTGWMLMSLIALAVAMVGFWLRRTATSVQGMWLMLTIVVPMALLGILPIMWQAVLFGVLTGGIFSGLVMLLTRCCGSRPSPRPERHKSRRRRPVTSTAKVLILAGVSLYTSSALAQSKVQQEATDDESFVVIPYDNLETLTTSERVWVPAKLYRKLWDAAHPEDRPLRLSVKSLVADARYDARIQSAQDVSRVIVQARWLIVTAAEESQQVRLPLSTGAVMQVQLDGEPAALTSDEKGNTSIILPAAGRHVVDARIELPMTGQLSVGEFRFATLPTASGMFSFELPEAGDPLRARVNDSRSTFRRVENTIQIPVDRGGTFRVAWQPERQQQDREELVQVESDLSVSVEDTGLAVRQVTQIRVRQGSINSLSLRLVNPDGATIRSVTGSDVSGWSFEPNENEQRLTVEFLRPVTSETRLLIDLFQPGEINNAAARFNLARLEPVNVSRLQGTITIFVPAHLRTRVVEQEGLRQMDLRSVPDRSQWAPDSATAVASFRFSAGDFRMVLEAVRRETEIRVQSEYAAELTARRTIIASRFQINLIGPPKQLLEIVLPSGFQPLDVVCQGAEDWSVMQAGDETRLILQFSKPVSGVVEVGLQGDLPREAAGNGLTLQLPSVPGASSQTSTLGVWFEESIEATLTDSQDWRSVPPQTLPENTRRLRRELPDFSFRTDSSPSTLSFQLQQSRAGLVADAGVLIAVGDVTIDYGLTLRWKFSGGSEDQLVVVLPDWVANLDWTGQGVRQIRSEDLGDGRRRWTISLIEPVRDEYLMSAASTIPIPQDQQVIAPLVEFESRGTAAGGWAPAETQRRFAVLVNLSANQLMPVQGSQGEPLRVEQLPLKMPVQLVQQAMEFVRVRPGQIPAWRIEPITSSDVASAVVLSAQLKTLLEMDGSWRTMANYAVRNRGRQFLALEIPEQSRILSVFVRNQPSRTVSTILDEREIHLIALPRTSEADLSFDVFVVLAGQLPRPLPRRPGLLPSQINLPAPNVIPADRSSQYGLPVARTAWEVFLPEELDAWMVSRSGASNLTRHRDRDESVLVRQEIDRLKADLTGLTKVIEDESTTLEQRTRAQTNIIELQQRLSAPADSSSDWSEGNLRYDAEWKELLDESQRALSSELPGLQGTQRDYSVTDNRSYIASQNGLLIQSNSAISQSIDRDLDGLSLNFFSSEAPRAQQRELAEEVTRGRLKGELAKQSSELSNLYSQGLQDGKPDSMGIGQRMMGGPEDSGGLAAGFGRFGNAEAEPGMAGQNGAGLPWPSYSPHHVEGLDRSSTFNDFNGIQGQPEWEQIPFRQGSFDLPMGALNGMAQPPVQLRNTWTFGDGAAPPASGPVPSWTAAGGLSVPVSLTLYGQQLTFSKVGGQPELTLSIQSRETWLSGLGIMWLAIVLGWGLWMIFSLRGRWGTRSLIHAVAWLGVLVTGWCVLWLSGPAWAWTLVAFGVLTVVALSVKPNARVTRVS